MLLFFNKHICKFIIIILTYCCPTSIGISISQAQHVKMLNKFFKQLKADGITLLRLIQSECLHNIKAVILLLMLLHILTIEIFYGNADIQDVLCYSYT